jgi:hypothetical protein
MRRIAAAHVVPHHHGYGRGTGNMRHVMDGPDDDVAATKAQSPHLDKFQPWRMLVSDVVVNVVMMVMRNGFYTTEIRFIDQSTSTLCTNESDSTRRHRCNV